MVPVHPKYSAENHREWYAHARMIVQRWLVRANTLVVHFHSQQHQPLSPSIRPQSSQPLQAPQQDLQTNVPRQEVKVFQQGMDEHEAGSCDVRQVVLSRTELDTYAHDIERARL